MKGSQAFRTSSPILHEKSKPESDHTVIRECPIGMILRETPYIFDALAAHSYIETGAINPMEQSNWLQSAFRVISAEKERHRNAEQSTNQSQADSLKGQNMLRRMRGHG